MTDFCKWSLFHELSYTAYDIMHNFYGRTVGLGSTRPLTEMSTRYLSWEVKTAGA